MNDIDAELIQLQQRLAALCSEQQFVQSRIAELMQEKHKLSMQSQVRAAISQYTPQEKIAIFRRLFKGREDVYPKRFESQKTGRSGYQPVCANEWKYGLCSKPKVKCAECPNRKLLPMTDAVIEMHLRGHDEA